MGAAAVAALKLRQEKHHIGRLRCKHPSSKMGTSPLWDDTEFKLAAVQRLEQGVSLGEVARALGCVRPSFARPGSSPFWICLPSRGVVARPPDRPSRVGRTKIQTLSIGSTIPANQCTENVRFPSRQPEADSFFDSGPQGPPSGRRFPYATEPVRRRFQKSGLPIHVQVVWSAKKITSIRKLSPNPFNRSFLRY